MSGLRYTSPKIWIPQGTLQAICSSCLHFSMNCRDWLKSGDSSFISSFIMWEVTFFCDLRCCISLSNYNNWDPWNVSNLWYSVTVHIYYDRYVCMHALVQPHYKSVHVDQCDKYCDRKAYPGKCRQPISPCITTWDVCIVLGQLCHTLWPKSCFNIYLLSQGWRSYVVVRSSIMSVSRITHDHGNWRRPNMVGMGKGWPSRSD